MLKRYQVLLNDWMADFIKQRAEKFDISFSETIRMVLCLYHIMLISELCKECKTDISIKKNAALVKKWTHSPKYAEEMHRTMSETYFKARKAIEYFQKKDRNSKITKKRTRKT